MSWITKRNKPDRTIQWLYRWSANGIRRTRILPHVKSKREAEKIRRQWDYQRQIEQTIIPPLDSWTLEKAYQELLKQKTFSLRYEVEFHRFYEKSIFSFFGVDINLRDIAVGDIKQWIVWRKKQTGRDGRPVRNSTIRHEFYALSECFQLAVEFNILSANPCSNIPLKKILPNDAQRRERVLTHEEIECLLDNCEGHIKTFVILAWATAGRMSEILQLHWGDLDLEKGTITFHHDPPYRRTKNKKTHCVFVAKKFL